MVRIGIHASIGKGLVAALVKAQRIGANCIQIFSSAPRAFSHPKVAPEIWAEFKAEALKRDIGPNFIHATYLVNLASGNPELIQKSVKSLINDLVFADKIGAKGTIVHTGSYGTESFAARVPIVAQAVTEILANTPTSTTLFLEIASGGKGKVGSTFEELQILVESVNNSRVGVCLDTAHLFAGGYSFNTPEEVEKLAEKIKRTIGWEKVGCLHANDSKSAFGSFRDRHENIGKGEIGLEPFRLLIQHEKFSQLPFILEVPGYDDKGPDGKNIRMLKSLLA